MRINGQPTRGTRRPAGQLRARPSATEGDPEHVKDNASTASASLLRQEERIAALEATLDAKIAP
jgi:hypothetical protein